MIGWGDAVNAPIAEMVHGCGPSPGVREAMQAMYDDVDEIIVSATPVEALRREWTEHGPARYTRLIAGQEMGSKAEHVHYAAAGKYPSNHIPLIGDAPGDRDAAAKAGCPYYPILPGEENASWHRFATEALPKFLDETLVGAYQDSLIEEFNAKLPDVVGWETVSGIRTVTMPTVK